MILYHLTNKDNLVSILTNGLVPKCGKNSQLIDDYTNSLYLCDRKSVDYWSILLNARSLVEVITNENLLCRSYEDFREYSYDRIIPSENCKYVGDITPKDDVMVNLCKSKLNSLIIQMLEISTIFSEENFEYIDELLDIRIFSILERLDFNVMSKVDFLEVVPKNVNLFRLAKIIETYPQNICLDFRKRLVEFVDKNFTKFR